MVIKQIPEDAVALCKAHANCQTWDTDQLVCSWIVHSVLSAQPFYFYVLWAVVRANWVPLWLKMLRKLRQMAQIQTRVTQKGERGLALQSGVTAGHGPALHLLVFSKAHVQQLCFSPVILAIKPLPPFPPKKCVEHAPCRKWRPRRVASILFLHASGAQLCVQSELAGLSLQRGFSVNCSA